MKILGGILLLVLGLSSEADEIVTPDQVPVALENIVSEIIPGTVVILGEIHDQKSHHDHQVEFLRVLHGQHPEWAIDLGMEFFEYPDQIKVDDYLSGELKEPDFLNVIRWGSFPFEFYRDQVQFPRSTGGQTFGINAPRWLTSKVAKTGLNSLAPEEKAFLPPQFELGRSEYFARFKESLQADGGSHPLPDSAIERYFQAQSIWDDTMAWKALEAKERKPDSVLVILVGDFHAVYDGGLPFRLKARGARSVLTFSQIIGAGLSPKELSQEIQDHPRWGRRADYIWVSN